MNSMKHRLHSALSAILTVAVTMICASPSLGSDVASDERLKSRLALVDVWLDALQDYRDIPGLAVGIVLDQELVFSRGYGYANIEKEIPFTPQTTHNVCSVSKLFTSLGVMQLRDQGKVSLNDSLASQLPALEVNQTYADGPEITLRDLLTHTSGLPREADFPYWIGPEYKTPTREQILDALPRQATEYPASSYYQYSNLGMVLLGELVQQVTGESFADYIEGSVIGPLGLQETSLSLTEQQLETRSIGYSAKDRDGHSERMPFFPSRGLAPAAGVFTTVEDMARFMSWQFRALDSTSDGIVKAGTLGEMQRAVWADPDGSNSRGLGFDIIDKASPPIVGHFGQCPGIQSAVFIQPESKFGVVVMLNTSGTEARQLLARLFRLVGPAIAQAPADQEPENTPGAVQDIDKFLGKYSLFPFGGELAAIPWEQGVALVMLPSADPMQGMMILEQEDGNRFRRLRADQSLAEVVTFEADEKGRVIKLRRHGNVFEKFEH